MIEIVTKTIECKTVVCDICGKSNNVQLDYDNVRIDPKTCAICGADLCDDCSKWYSGHLYCEECFNAVEHLLREKNTIMDEMYIKFDIIDEQIEEISNKKWRK